jgi:hypothetical protein
MSNPDETARLIKKMFDAGHEIGITAKVKAELVQYGVSPHTLAKVKVCDDPSDRILVCMAIAPFEKPILPDNLFCPCAFGCGRTVQYRSNIGPEIMKVCLSCASDMPKDKA